MSEIAALEEDIKQYREQLDVVNAGLSDDPSSAELLALKSELDDALSLLNETLADLKPSKPAPRPQPKAPSPPAGEEKWSRENHPAFKKAAPPVEEKVADTSAVSYKVNDTVMAKWVSGDKGYYTGRITSITGSSTDPIYIVKFKSYDETEQLRGRDIRPIAQKRKADGAPTTTSSSNINPPPPNAPVPSQPPPPANPGVISAAASINPELAAQNGEAAEKATGGDAKPKYKKIKATKELEAGKNKWQDFNAKTKTKGSKPKKDSMFRTPDGIHGRVGFTGSGQAMRKDPTRSRHIYNANDEVE